MNVSTRASRSSAPQKHEATVLDCTLRVEMNALEEQADNAKVRDLYWKPRGSGPSSSANDAFDPAVLRLAVACATLGALAKGASTTGASMRQSVASIPCLLRDACSLPRRQSAATAPEGDTGPWGPLRLRGGSRKNSKKNRKAKHRFQCQVLARTPPQRARVRCRCLVCLCSSLSPPPPPPLSFSLSLSRARAFSLIQPRIQVYNTEIETRR